MRSGVLKSREVVACALGSRIATGFLGIGDRVKKASKIIQSPPRGAQWSRRWFPGCPLTLKVSKIIVR